MPRPKLTDEERKRRERARAKAWRLANPERAKANGDRYRREHREELLAKKRAYHHANRDAILEKKRVYSAATAEHCRAKAKAWHWANRERANAESKAYYHSHREAECVKHRLWNAKNKSAKAASAKARRPLERERYATDPEHRAKAQAKSLKWKQANRERVNDYSRRYGQQFPEVLAAQCAKRRARKLAADTEADTPAYRAFLKHIRTVNRIACYWCGKRIPKGPRKRHVDHIIPLAKGGTDTLLNLCCSCAWCNQHKSDKMPHEFSGQHVLVFG